MPELAYTVRRFNNARPDLRDAFRIHLSSAALQSLQLKPGDFCELGTAANHYHTAIAWASSEKPPLGPRIAQVSATLQDICQLNLGDRISISRNETSVQVPNSIVVSEHGSSDVDASDLHPGYWRRSVENLIIEAGCVWVGMTLNIPRHRRAFRIVKIDYSESTDRIYRVGSGTSVSVDNAFVPSRTEVMTPRLEIARDGVGGLVSQMDEIDARMENYSEHLDFLRYPTRYRPFTGAVLLHGPSGTGKTLLLEKAAKAAWKQVISIDLYQGENRNASGYSFVERTISGINRDGPSLLILDGLELCSKEAERTRLVALLAREIRSLNNNRVLVLGATNSIKDLDPELRRDCFEHLIEIPPPDVATRTQILKIVCQTLDSGSSSLFTSLGERTHGYTGADLYKLDQLAIFKAKCRMKRRQQPPPSYEESQNLPGPSDSSAHAMLIEATAEDYEAAMREIRPSAMRDVFLETPKVSWDDIGGQGATRDALEEAIEWPFQYPQLMAAAAAPPAKGLLLYGPPGCSKTLTAAALATASDLNFLAVKGAELLSMYVGESERAVRRIFARARAAAPAILFFDEIDAIGGTRSASAGGSDHGGGVGATVLTTLLNELDGIEALTGVFVLAATNRPAALDPALVRPGRLDRCLYVGLPDRAARADILRIRLARVRAGRLDPALRAPDAPARARLADATAGYSGAEVVRVCERAAIAMVREEIAAPARGRRAVDGEGVGVQVGVRHFETALQEVPRMVTREMLQQYEQWGMNVAPATVPGEPIDGGKARAKEESWDSLADGSSHDGDAGEGAASLALR